MKYCALILMFLFLVMFLVVGVIRLQAPQCEHASDKERLALRCQKALYEYRG